MPSSEPSVPFSVAARNPRRRQRTGSDDSVALRHHPKRIRRSGLTSETFQPPVPSKLNGYNEVAEEGPYTNGHAVEPSSQRHSSAEGANLAIRHRGVKRADRENRNDGSIELVSRTNQMLPCSLLMNCKTSDQER